MKKTATTSYPIQELLADRDKTEVNRIRKAMGEVEKLREQLEEAEALLA